MERIMIDEMMENEGMILGALDHIYIYYLLQLKLTCTSQFDIKFQNIGNGIHQRYRIIFN
jgi:hypothetical protein